ncbi:metallophosphoesterase [Leucobacter sp. HY1910]
MSRLIFIGDVGGHPSVFEACLRQVGVGADCRIPDGVTLLQVGDLVRCTKAHFRAGNLACVELAERLLAANPDQYIQLAGNHEAAALGGPKRETWEVDASLCLDTRLKLSRMWESRQMCLAHAVTSRSGVESLITHAGLTLDRWLSLGAPTSAHEAAQIVNRDIGRDMAAWSRAGSLVGERDLMADTMWAEVNLEFYQPWLRIGTAPFNQIHGHASPHNWNTDRWWDDATPAIRAATRVDHVRRRTVTRSGGRGTNGFSARSVDWVLGDGAPPAGIWPLYELHTEE